MRHLISNWKEARCALMATTRIALASLAKRKMRKISRLELLAVRITTRIST